VALAADLTYTFNRSNGFDRELRNAGHARSFYFSDQNCWSNDLKDTGFGGDDRNFADKVDLFWIETHGSQNSSGQASLLYDTPRNDWRGVSSGWQLGEDFNAEWVMAYSCKTAQLPGIANWWNVFQGLHLYCGAWENMYDGITTDECGEDVGDNLTDGDTVSESWIDGVSDWWVDNHPIVVGPGTSAAWNGGNIQWHLTAINIDHLWGHGSVSSDLAPAQQGCMVWRWAEG
jgi:hypothetical protein